MHKHLFIIQFTINEFPRPHLSKYSLQKKKGLLFCSNDIKAPFIHLYLLFKSIDFTCYKILKIKEKRTIIETKHKSTIYHFYVRANYSSITIIYDMHHQGFHHFEILKFNYHMTPTEVQKHQTTII